MPIRINLLAAEQAAEDLRRRDPIKRAMFGGCALLVGMVLWIGATQMQVRAAKSELANYNNRLKKVEDSSKQVRSSQIAALDGEGRLKALDRYTENRFFWGTFLDALQHAAVDNIRLTEVKADQKYTSADANKFFITNITVTYTPPPASWKFWASRKAPPTVSSLVSNVLTSVTNVAPFTTNTLPYGIKISETGTNAAMKQVTSLVEFSNVPWAKERIIIEVRGRDYGSNPGAALDEFAKRINSSAFFKTVLEPGQGFRFTERPPQPRPDPQDVLNPNALFVPFTIELVLDERTFTNDQTF